jgi:hypothetical protein
MSWLMITIENPQKLSPQTQNKGCKPRDACTTTNHADPKVTDVVDKDGSGRGCMIFIIIWQGKVLSHDLKHMSKFKVAISTYMPQRYVPQCPVLRRRKPFALPD